jgi:TRAP-type C4-dicarboxylate transport system substrate-binding protein
LTVVKAARPNCAKTGGRDAADFVGRDHDDVLGGYVMTRCLRWRSRTGVKLLTLGFGIGLLAAAPSARATETIPALTTADVRQATSAAGERLARELEQLTQGRARIEFGQPGATDTAAVLERVRGGEATLGLVRVAEIAGIAPEVALLTVPFLFRDQQKAMALLEATWLGPLLQDELRKHGLEPLGFLNGGALRLAGRQAAPALGPEQPQQVEARPGELRAAAFRALGLEPVPGPQAPPNQSAQLVEVRTDDLAASVTAGQGGLQVVEAPHAYDLVVLIAHRERFGELPLDIREALRTRMQDVASWQNGALQQTETLAMAGVKQQGGRLVALPDDQLRQAHELVKAAVVAALRDADPSIVGTLMAYAD